MSKPTISVVIPAFNHAEYLALTISSALAQTWRDFEVIVVDDGSTDNTAGVAAQFGDLIRYTRQTNRGIGGARNTGVRLASGEMISFLDDDDLWEPDHLERTVRVFREKPNTAAAHTGWQAIDENGERLALASTMVARPEEMYDSLIIGGFFTGACVTVRRECFARVGPFDETLRGCDDWDMWLRVSRTFVFRGLADKLVLYRMHSGGLSADGVHMFEDRLRVVAKHFGDETGDPLHWADRKRRAYGFAYRWGALGHAQAGRIDVGWEHLKRAVAIYPELLGRLDTFYELACGNQPRAQRGNAEMLEVERNADDMLARLDRLFIQAGGALDPVRKKAFGNAFLALAMLADQGGDWALARRYLLRAVGNERRLLTSAPIIRRMVKLAAGKRLVGMLVRKAGT